jgi:hypothetical protein
MRPAPVPDDDVTTLQVSFYLVGKKSLDNDMIASFTQALTSARRDVVGEFPILAQVKAPDTDAGAYLPVHPGAAEFYNGNQQTFLDKWSNAIFWRQWRLARLLKSSRRPGSFSDLATLSRGNQRSIHSMRWGEE